MARPSSIQQPRARVFYKNRVFVAIGQDPEHGEGVGRLLCLDPTKTGDVTNSALVWDYKGAKRSISTVSIDPSNGLLYLADFSGFVHCLDSETGKLHWVHDMQAHMWGSTFVAERMQCWSTDFLHADRCKRGDVSGVADASFCSE